MGAQNNSTRWFPDGFTIHLEVMEVVKLCVLTSVPLFPCAQGTKLTSRKAANGLLSWGDCLRLYGLYDLFHFFCGEGGLREIKVWVANRGDAMNISKHKLVVMINIRNSTGFHDIMFSHSASFLGRGELAFDS